MTYVGVCYDSLAWGGDLTGLLVAKNDAGWGVVSAHISSSEAFSRIDIEGHYARRDDPQPGDTFEWLGRLEHDALEERFGWTI